MKYLSNHPWISLVILIAGTFLLFFVFYQIANCRLEYANPGLFGDFMGGVIGTILTALAAFFVYRTYQTQKSQVETQNKDFELRKIETDLTHIDELYEKISKDIDDLEVTFFLPGASHLTSYNGIYVLYNFSTLYHKDNSVLNQLALILISFEHLIGFVEEFKTKWKTEIPLNEDRNYLMFYTKVLWPIHKFYGSEWNKLVKHPDTPITKTRFEKLAKNCLNYLLKRKLIGKPDDNVYVKFID